MKVTLLLADAAEAVNGKVYMLGGGWSMTGPGPSTFAIAGKIEVPWDEANRPHVVKFELLDEDGQPVTVPTPTGDRPLEVEARFEVGRPPGLKPGTPLDLPIAFNLGPIQLSPDRRFVWRISVDGRTNEDWNLSFTTRPASGPQPGA